MNVRRTFQDIVLHKVTFKNKIKGSGSTEVRGCFGYAGAPGTLEQVLKHFNKI